MGKTKVTDKSSKKAEISSVKAGRVTKPAQTPKSKSKDIAKSAVKEKKKSKKAKTPTPEPESESESDSSASEEEKDSSASSEDEKVQKKAPAKAAAKDDSDSSDSSDDSESDSNSKGGVKLNGAAKAAADSDSSDSDSDSESEAEKPAAKASKADAESSDDSDSSDDSESDEEEAPSKKRKAEAEAEPVAKKTKTEAPAVASDAIANLFVGSLSWNIDEDWLRREFEQFGDIVGCRVITDRESGRSKGFGYVEFGDAADAAKAHAEMNGYELDGRALNVDFSTPRQKPDNKTNDRANKYGDKRSAPANTLFLGNLSFDCSNEGIQEIFAEYGSITRVSLPTDRDTGSLKGFGYVDFTTTEEATAALEALNGQEVEGRAIRIDYAAPRADNGGGGGRGGGFGGGRGGGGGFGGGRGGGRGGGFGGRGGGRGGFGDRGGRGGGRGGARGRGGFGTNRGGFGDFQGQKKSFD